MNHMNRLAQLKNFKQHAHKMKKTILILLILFSSLALAQENFDKVYELKIENNNNTLTIEGLRIIPYTNNIQITSHGENTYQIIKNNQTLFESNFFTSDYYILAPDTPLDIQKPQFKKLLIYVPYFPANEIILKDSNNKTSLEIDVSRLDNSRTSNQEVIIQKPQENKQKQIIQKDISNQNTIEQAISDRNIKLALIGFVAFLIFFFIIAIIYLIKRKHQ